MWRLLAVLLSVAFAQAGYAQTTDCNAVLQNGTYKYSQFASNSYYQQILYSQFLRTTFQSSKTEKGIGIDVPVGKAVMGSLDYDEAAFMAKQESLRDTRFSQVTAINSTQTMLASGDGDILKAWLGCVYSKRGSLAAYFEPRTSTLATLVVQWLPGDGPISEAKLSQNVNIIGADPSFKLPDCLKANKKIKQGVGCRVSVPIKDAWTPLTVDVNSYQGNAGAFVPARIKLVSERLPVQVPPYYLELFRLGTITTPDKVFTMDPADQAAGWVIDPSSVRSSVGKNFDNGRSGTNWCAGPTQTVGFHQIAYRFRSNTAKSGGDGWTIGCTMTVTAERIRDRWVADEIAKLPPPSLDYIPAGSSVG